MAPGDLDQHPGRSAARGRRGARWPRGDGRHGTSGRGGGSRGGRGHGGGRSGRAARAGLQRPAAAHPTVSQHAAGPSHRAGTGNGGPGRPRHIQRAAFDEFLKFMHPGIDDAAAAKKFLTALQDQVGFKGVKDVVWRLAKPAVAAEMHCSTASALDGCREPGPSEICGVDTIDDKAPGLKRVEELLRCAASNESSGITQMVLPLLEALLVTKDGEGAAGGGLIDRAMADLLLQVRRPVTNEASHTIPVSCLSACAGCCILMM